MENPYEVSSVIQVPIIHDVINFSFIFIDWTHDIEL